MFSGIHDPDCKASTGPRSEELDNYCTTRIFCYIMRIVKYILSGRNTEYLTFRIFKCAFNFNAEINRSAETGKKTRTKTTETKRQ